MEPNEIKDILLRSITEDISAEDRAVLDAALAGSEVLQREQEELLLTRDLVRRAIPPADSGFTRRVMTKLNRGRKEVALVVRLFPRVAAACIAVLVALSLFLYFEAGSLSTEVLVGLEDLSVEEAVALTEY